MMQYLYKVTYQWYDGKKFHTELAIVNGLSIEDARIKLGQMLPLDIEILGITWEILS